MSGADNLAGQRLGGYRLERVLGRGNMGVVYYATDEALLRPTAVKVLAWSPAELDPEAWFLAEARSVARLNHPSVVQIYSVARQPPYCYIAMEYVDGMSADVMLRRGGPLGGERATEIMLQIVDALATAHDAGLIHRDIKPGNILVGPDGAAKLGDFGMAVTAQAVSGQVRAGTPHYFAPELWRSEPASVATDLYAIGATYYHLLTGEPPFDAANVAALSAAHLRKELAIPPELADERFAACRDVLRRCMAKQAADRWGSARDLAEQLRGVLRALAKPVAPALKPRVSLTFDGAPFGALAHTLRGALATPGAVVVLDGDLGSGRTTLARDALAAHAGGGAYLELDASTGRRPGAIQRLARAFGAVAGNRRSAAGELDALLEALATPPAAEAPTTPRAAEALRAPLLVLDGVVPRSQAAIELELLARAAASTRYFALLAVAPAALVPDARVLRVPALAPDEVAGYINHDLAAHRDPDGPLRLITPDAALLVAARTGGALRAIHAVAEHLRSHGGPVISTWDAWIAPLTPSDDIPARDARRPMRWPTPEVLALINDVRSRAGRALRVDRVADAIAVELALDQSLAGELDRETTGPVVTLPH